MTKAEKIYIGLLSIFLAIFIIAMIALPFNAKAEWTVVQNSSPTGGGSGVMWQSDTDFCLYNYDSGGILRAGADSNCLGFGWIGSATLDQQAINDAYSADPTTLPTASAATLLGYGPFDWPCDWSQFSDPCPPPTPEPITPTPGSSLWIIMQPIILLSFVGMLFARAL